MNKKDTTILYKLICPIENKIRYIGITNNPNLRLKHHLTCKNNKLKYEWIKRLKGFNQKPIMKIIQKYDTLKEAEIQEQKLIETLPDLLNGKKYKNYTIKTLYIYDVENYNTFKNI